MPRICELGTAFRIIISTTLYSPVLVNDDDCNVRAGLCSAYKHVAYDDDDDDDWDYNST